MDIDADPVLWSDGEQDQAGRPLLVLLHGYGSHEGDLMSLRNSLPHEPVLASLRAPISLGQFESAWWPLRVPVDPGALGADVAASDDATRAVLTWLDSLDHDGPVGLLGFSQGAALAVQLLRRAPKRFAFAVALSGFVLPLTKGDTADARLAQERPAVFWGRGTLDCVIPQELLAQAEEWFPAHTTVDARIYEGVAHAISPAELTDISAFIRQHFGLPTPSPTNAASEHR
ncbi:alpha/beta hydrolase [Rathayibacter toxicus]|uniref:alpha/beta hydrolase n=1 Tax=Rathayibacter toxicus TaxID=145458 RepID=UPI001C04E584|nr:dienelactone hydrolase family protein [Rathayibacter toxicus]QWL32991.1 phospholipase [Rathayibacter toxicus]QWL35085.1 phospholipase [Rathayibacter toxicus]QWL37216.1 phospholipase [Rathayibacter toxicus]QWL39308.1 phospholipase [Rathayibacter toxicus]QWL41394.1 phospholipase [Rathayibacter toxicus]